MTIEQFENVIPYALHLDGSITEETRALLTVAMCEDRLVRMIAERWVVDELRRIHRDKALQVERDAQNARRRQGLPRSEISPQERERQAEWDREHSLAFGQKMQQIMADYEQELKMTWTRELLETTFALDDGTMVTWGNATIDQHRERHAMFTRNAVANAEGAARHGAAIRDLSAAGAERLREIS